MKRFIVTTQFGGEGTKCSTGFLRLEEEYWYSSGFLAEVIMRNLTLFSNNDFCFKRSLRFANNAF